MAKQTQLKTGNTDATKPGKAERFAITQDEADGVAQLGCDYAAAEAAAEFACESVTAALGLVLRPLAGKVNEAAAERWNHLRAAFIAGYMEGRAIDEDSARKAWGRAIKPLGLKKPQTPKAAELAAKRAADAKANPKKAGTGEDEPEDDPMVGAADAAADAVQMALSKLEAHLISMVRAGKFEQAAQCIADMADAK